MGVSSEENAELDTYQPKYVAQVLYEHWNDERLVIEGRITWGAFKMILLGRFIPLELKEMKMQEFINIFQEGMMMKEYSLNFTQQSKYAPTMIGDSRAKMNKFVMGISDLVVNECR